MNLWVMGMLDVQFVAKFDLVRGLLRAVLILTLVIVKRQRKRNRTGSLMNGKPVGCRSSAALKHFDYSKSALQASFFTGVGWMKSPMKTMPSTFLHSGLNQFLMQVVL